VIEICHSASGGFRACCRAIVMRAEKGIPVVNSRAACGRVLIAVPRTAGGFLSLLVQRKKPKKARPGAADDPLRFSPARALTNSSAAEQRGSTRTGARLTAPARTAMLGGGYGIENPSGPRLELVCYPPRVASRAPSKAGGRRETFDRARGALHAPGELGERPAEARRAGDRASCARRATRGVFLFGDFLLDKQEEVTCRGSATHKYASPQATQNYVVRINSHG